VRTPLCETRETFAKRPAKLAKRPAKRRVPRVTYRLSIGMCGSTVCSSWTTAIPSPTSPCRCQCVCPASSRPSRQNSTGRAAGRATVAPLQMSGCPRLAVLASVCHVGGGCHVVRSTPRRGAARATNAEHRHARCPRLNLKDALRERVGNGGFLRGVPCREI
jgi:hypothetical protein